MGTAFEGGCYARVFSGRLTGREGHIVCEEDGKRLQIWWESGVDRVLFGQIPVTWEVPFGESLSEQHQRAILDSLCEWLRTQGIRSDLTNDPWVNSADDLSNKCAWAKCGRPTVVGYSVCRWHILQGYISEKSTNGV